MKLKQKLKGLKKIPQILLLSAVTSTISSGCSTTQPWKTVGRESVPTGVTKNYIEKTERETMNLKELKISDIKLDKDMKISVSESLDRKDYIIEYPITEKEVQEFLIEQRRISTTAPGGAIAGTLLGIIGGVYLGDLIESDPEKKFGVILTGTLGGVLGMGLGAYLDDSVSRTETRKRQTGLRGYERTSQNPKIRVEKISSVYKNKPAVNLNLDVSSDSLKKEYRTDKNGNFNVSDFVESFNKSYFFRIYSSKEELEKRIKDIPLVKDIKPNTLEHLMNDMIKGLSSKRIVLKVETKEKPLTNREEIINDSKLFEVRGYHLSDDTIYSAVKNFVDKEINSSIRNLEFSVKDAITYFPIDGTNFEIQTESPSKSNLAERYFKDKLKTYAERLIIDYLQGNVVIRNCPSELNFKVYTPSKINLTVVHPDYNFVKGEISAEKGDLKKVVYMLDKGQKIRIESAGDEKGRIE